MQELPGAPGTARQGRTGTSVPATRGGVATQPRAPGHGRPPAAQRAAGHGRLSAATGAPGADVPLASTAGAPGQHCLSAVPRAPGHGRPLAALSAARHDRPCATLRAPGADVPLATTARAPGQHRLSAVPPAPDHARSRARHPKAPGHGRPLAAQSSAVGHDRPCATLTAPGHDVPLASTAGAPGYDRLSAVASATAALPAGLRRLRQGVLPRVPANPRTLTYPHSHRDTAHTRAAFSHTPRYAQSRESRNPPLSTMWRGAGSEGRHLFPLSSGRPQTTHQVHPAVQVPPRPRSCSTACTGLLLQNSSRAPPKPTRRKPILASRFPLSTMWRGPG